MEETHRCGEAGALARSAQTLRTEANKGALVIGQPFVDDHHRARALYRIERQAYFDKVPDATLKEINRRRTLKGLNKIHRKRQASGVKRPVSSFLRFVMFLLCFRTSPSTSLI